MPSMMPAMPGMTHRAGVEQSDAVILAQDDVAGVQVGVEDAAHPDLVEDGLQQCVGEALGLCREHRSRVQLSAWRSVDTHLHDHPSRRVLLVHRRQVQPRRRARRGERRAKHLGVRHLDAVVELIAQHAQELRDQGARTVCLRPLGALLGLVRQTLQDGEIGRDLRAPAAAGSSPPLLRSSPLTSRAALGRRMSRQEGSDRSRRRRRRWAGPAAPRWTPSDQGIGEESICSVETTIRERTAP